MNPKQFFSKSRNSSIDKMTGTLSFRPKASMNSRSFSALGLCLVMALMCLLGITSITRADMGPKPSIEIHVKNPPAGKYYIALLGKDDYSNRASWGKEYLDYDKRPEEEQEILDFLLVYNYDGYMFHITPVGSCFFASNERHTYRFTYTVPSTFKVILLSADGDTVISEPITRTHFNSVCSFDVSTGKVKEDPLSWKTFFVSAICCLVVTLLIEFILLAVFRFRIGKCIKRFLVTNLLTQILLNVALVVLDRNGITSLLFLIWWVFLEVVIVVIEALSYKDHFCDKEDVVRPSENIAYAIVANLASALIEFPIILFITK
ncbi:MAG: hypothetical protein J5379_09770 [Clostridiales bacterium]|nr:hypothetical protein [Clostridiales bacterium]